MSYKHIDLEFFKSFYDGNDGFKVKMISMFMDKAPGFLNEMKEHLKEHKWSDLAASAHKFKSCIDFIGAKNLRVAADEIEKSAKGADFEIVSDLVNSINSICNEVITELQKELLTIKVE